MSPQGRSSAASFDGCNRPRSSEAVATHTIMEQAELSSPSESLRQQASDLITTFTLFPLLPAEIRIKIWKHTHPPPRAIPISHPRYQESLSYRPAAESLNGFTKELLLVNHEARQVLLEEYTLLFYHPQMRWDYYSQRVEWMKIPPKWYFNFEWDSLAIPGLEGLKYFLTVFPTEMGQIRYLDIAPVPPPVTPFAAQRPFDLSICHTQFSNMKALRLITIRKIETTPTHVPAPPSITPWNCMADTTISLTKALRGHGSRVKLAVQFLHEDLSWTASYDHQYREFYDGAWASLREVDDDVWKRWEALGLRERSNVKGGMRPAFQVSLPGSFEC